jgi:hypothetical protein
MTMAMVIAWPSNGLGNGCEICKGYGMCHVT